jgi:hypothetical protein
VRPGEYIFFTSYALARPVLPFSSFFTLLEWYDLQLHHLSTHSITLVAIFVHFCEMYVGVRPSVHLFMLFHVLRSLGKRASPIGCLLLPAKDQGYNCVHRCPHLGKWDCWRDDWVIMHTEVHDWLELSTTAPMVHRNSWEKVPDLQSAYLLVLKRIWFLAENMLTSMILLFDIFVEAHHPSPAACPPDLDVHRGGGCHVTGAWPSVLTEMQSKLSIDPSSASFIKPLARCMPLCLDQAVRSQLLKELPMPDNIDITP